jgi:hypothetical protein
MQFKKDKNLFNFLKIGLPFILLGANLAGIIWMIIRFLNLTFPFVGRDYMTVVPEMLDIELFYRLNGLAIQWYTPSFGGGMPAYSDGNQTQFSLEAFLSLLLPIWKTVTISSVIYIAVGVLASYYFFKKVLGLDWTSSLLGSVFFSLNGFITQRIAVGHVGFLNFAIFPLFLIFLCDSSIPWILAAMLLGLLIASMINMAGYVIIVIFGLSTLITLPLIYIYNSNVIHWKSIFRVFAFGSLVTLLISASKLSAVYAFMRYFPRLIQDVSSNNTISGLASIIYQLLGTMNLAPLFWAVGRDINQIPQFMLDTSGSIYGFFWEFDMSLSPVIFLILVGGVIGLLSSPKKNFEKLTSNKKWIAWLVLFFSVWLTGEFILAKGLIYPLIRNLPILGSLHVNMRFTSAFLFPLVLTAALFYNKWLSRWSPKVAYLIFFILNILTILPFVAYFLIPAFTYLSDYDVTEMLITDRIIDSGAPFKIQRIEDVVNNSRAMKRGISNLRPFNALFGYDLRYFHSELKVGSVWEISDGYYNMTNPTGFVFPEINGTRPFERIRVDDGENLKLFTMHLQPNWKIPFYQQFFDWVSGLSFICISGAILGYPIKKVFKSRSRNFPLVSIAIPH